MNKIIINTPEDFINCNFNNYSEIIISQALSLPFINPEAKQFCFEINNEYPLFYRTKYLHPRRYQDLFPLDFSKKIDDLRIFVKRGNNLLFKLVYRSWNLKFKSNQDRLESAIRSEKTRRQQPKKSFKFSAFNDDKEIQTDVHLLIDFRTNYICMKYTIPRLIANGRKRLKKKPLHYEFFKRKGEKLLEIEAKLSKDYKKMMKHLTVIYKAKK